MMFNGTTVVSENSPSVGSCDRSHRDHGGASVSIVADGGRQPSWTVKQLPLTACRGARHRHVRLSLCPAGTVLCGTMSLLTRIESVFFHLSLSKRALVLQA